MHRVRFRDPAGTIRVGRLVGEMIEAAGRRHDPEDVDILPPSQPTKLVCIGRNYAEHAAEQERDLPERPMLFLKGPNSIAGHGDTIELPVGKRVEHEAELAVVIERQARRIDADAVDEVIAGYTCGVDLSNRDDQRRERNWVRGKAFDGAAPVGPVLASPEEVSPTAGIELSVNGDLRQSSSIDEMVYGVEELLVEITEHLTLEAGDIVLTGTPAGVGPVVDGDTVTVEIDGIGTLQHSVRRTH